MTNKTPLDYGIERFAKEVDELLNPLRYVVRENAAYKGEREVYETDHAADAYRWIKKTYDPDELESLFVAVYDRKTKEYI